MEVFFKGVFKVVVEAPKSPSSQRLGVDPCLCQSITRALLWISPYPRHLEPFGGPSTLALHCILHCWLCSSLNFKGVVRIYDIPDNTFESSGEEDDDEEEEEDDDKGALNIPFEMLNYLARYRWLFSINIRCY